MKKIICGLVLFSFLAFFSDSVAQELPLIFSGKISNVDGGARTIVVKGEEKEMAFNIFDDTKIKTDYGVNVPFAELKSGMSVTIDYMKYDDSMDALSIRINTGHKGFGKKQKERQKKK